jgi:acyl-CoA dehydrogenase
LHRPAKVRDAGLETLLVSEHQGGFGGDWGDAFAVLRLAGAHAVDLPVGEAMVAARLSAESGFGVDGLMTLAPHAVGALDAKGRFSGRLQAVPWGGEAIGIVFDVEGGLACANVGGARIERAKNPAGEARDTVFLDNAPVERADSALSARAAGALVRTAQVAGALDAALTLSIEYANERNQFGKPIGKFQAVQQALAVFAEESAAVNCAGEAAAAAADRGDGAFEIAAAKLRANMAAAVGAATAHQVHGAIGFTQEHALHKLTRRLIAWRSEFGGERFWAERIGAEVCGRGADALWPFLSTRGDAA